MTSWSIISTTHCVCLPDLGIMKLVVSTLVGYFLSIRCAETVDDNWSRPEVLSTSTDKTIVEFARSAPADCGRDNHHLNSMRSMPVHVKSDTNDYLKLSLRIPLTLYGETCTKENFQIREPCRDINDDVNYIIRGCNDAYEECICDVDLEVTAFKQDIVFSVVATSSHTRKLEGTDRSMNSGGEKEGNVGNTGDKETVTESAQNLSPDDKKFDPGVITHAVLVVLAVIAFAGNAMFVVFVFWLSR